MKRTNNRSVSKSGKRVKADVMIAYMKPAGYSAELVTSCLREASVIKGRPTKASDLCLRDSQTHAAFLRGEKIWRDFDKTRVVQATASWTENFNRQIPGGPVQILVDKTSGVFRKEDDKTYGFLEDIKSCLTYISLPTNAGFLAKKSESINKINRWRQIEDEIKHLEHTYQKLAETEKEQVIDARRGQGLFRSKLIELWAKKCAVTKSCALDILRASHIKPWRDSTNEERLNQFNGLLLTPNLDAAFDIGLISFEDNGKILISPTLNKHEAELLGISNKMRLVCAFDESQPFLAFHRLHCFSK